MKNRQGFVTNSSSTSYIVKVKSGSENIKPDISNDEELREFIVKEYGWKDDTFEDLINEEPYYKEMYDEYKQIIDDGFSIICGIVSNDGDMYSDISYLLDKLGVQVEWSDC